MSEKFTPETPLEPERYELFAAPTHRFDFSRRQFFNTMGAGLAVVLVLKDALALQPRRGRRSGPPLPAEIGGWLHIAEAGEVTVFTGKVEVGQNIRTSLSQIVAEELRIPVESIRMVMGDTDLTPYDRGTFGSRTIASMGVQLRKVAAAARQVLVGLAARQLPADPGDLVVADGRVTDSKSARSLGFGELTRGQKLLETVGEVPPVTAPEEWKIAGKTNRKVGAVDFVTGRHKYSSDIRLPDMLYGKVLRPPSFGATLLAVNTQKAKSAGVTVVRDGSFVGVAAADEYSASRALAKIQAEWETTFQPSRAELFDYFRANPREARGRSSRSNHTVGSVADGLARADRTLKQTYTVDYIAHVPLEPRAAVAQWEGEKLTVWTGTQRPFGVRSELAQAFRIAEEQIRVIMPDTGSGYGGKHTGEAAVEAARLARAAQKPVKVVWTREEEFTWAYHRPAGVIDARSGVMTDGSLIAWEFHNYNSGGSAIRGRYEIPNQHIEFHPTETPLRQGSYRALAATANHFAREVHMDELARLIEMDPLEFRYKNLKDTRLRAVLEAAAGKFDWGRKRPAQGHGFGIAGGFEKGGYVATCAEVAVSPTSGKLKVIRVVEAFECGAIINPDHLSSQIEGAVVQGLGGALFESIDFRNGRILNPALSAYPVPRFKDVPRIEVVLVDRKDLPSVGGSETPIVGIAPALSNAIFDAVGVRKRSLPLVPDGLNV